MRVLGWVGISFFILYVVIGSIPSLDHPAFDANGEQRPGLWIMKVVLWLAVATLLALCFWHLGPKKPAR